LHSAAENWDTGDFELLDATATVLGAFKDRGFEERSVALRPGDRLVLFSDGFSEAKIEEAKIEEAKIENENWALETIREIARSHKSGFAGALASAAASFEPQADDITVMDLRVL